MMNLIKVEVMKAFNDGAYRNKPGYIYLIHAQGTNRYKIGLTTRSIEQRFSEFTIAFV